MGTKTLVAVAVVALLLGGCAVLDRDAPDSPRPAGTSTSSTPATAEFAYGTWSVQAKGDPRTTTLRLQREQIELVRPCGTLSGSWKVGAQGAFVVSIFGADGCRLPEQRDPAPAWLSGADRLVTSAPDTMELMRGGARLAELRRVGQGAVSPAPGYAPAPSFPAGLRPADRPELVGTWLPVLDVPRRADQDDPYLEIKDDGTFGGSDGCNGAQGAWRSARGELTVVRGPEHLIGCDNVPVADWFERARFAAFDGAELVLLAEGGSELGRFVQGLPPCSNYESCG